uniref:Magnetosome protein Mad4 n=1 Tax=Candidatus Magnetananas rongchengensis TaxID=1463558 RepID=A0A3S6IZQ4_9BACT|nr:magnetosome protein Mad4 [Candidatus Magnetananas rongchenensis]
MLQDYLKTKFKYLGFWAATIASSTVVTTGLYWSVFGFGHWQTEMNRAAGLMVAGAVQPMQQQQMQPFQQVQTGAVSGQFVCPTHGAVGLPNYDTIGTPHCPVCGQVMNFLSTSPQANYVPSQTGLRPAAGAG